MGARYMNDLEKILSGMWCFTGFWWSSSSSRLSLSPALSLLPGRALPQPRRIQFLNSDGAWWLKLYCQSLSVSQIRVA